MVRLGSPEVPPATAQELIELLDRLHEKFEQIRGWAEVLISKTGEDKSAHQ